MRFSIVFAVLFAAAGCSKHSDETHGTPALAPTPAPSTAPAPAAPAKVIVPIRTNTASPSGAAEPSSAPAAGGLAKVDIPNAILYQGNLLGGHPSPEELKAAAAAGYKTVINLQRPDEPGVADEATEAKTLGLDYVSIPVAGPGDFSRAKAEELDKALATAKAKGPAVVHCASGARVSGLYTLRAYYVEKKSPEDAIAEGKKAGLSRLEPMVRHVIASSPR